MSSTSIPTGIRRSSTSLRQRTSIREGYIIVSNADQTKFRVLDRYDQYSIKYDQSGYGQSIDQVIVEAP